MKSKLLLFALAIGIFISCSKSKITNNLEGTWVSVDKFDTIYFYKTGVNLLDVKRYFMNSSQRMLGSGQYIYHIKEDSIKPQLGISSLWNDRFYYFKKDGNELTIGNFFAMEKSTMVTTFKKISN